MTWTTRPRSDFAGLSAIVGGSGATLLLLHGVGLRAEAWNRQIDALVPRFRVVAPDLPGHGKSPVVRVPMTLGDYTDAVAAALESPVLVAGHSMGAMIALDLAARYPDRVRGVAALNAIFERSAHAAEAVRARAASLDGTAPPDPEPTLRRWFGQELSAERTACETWLRKADPFGYKAAYAAFATGDGPARQALRSLACPALFMTGALEPNSTPLMSQAMAGLAPRGRAVIVPGAAHMMPMTHPAPVTAELLRLAEEVLA